VNSSPIGGFGKQLDRSRLALTRLIEIAVRRDGKAFGKVKISKGAIA
jgi:hypothetical protein